MLKLIDDSIASTKKQTFRSFSTIFAHDWLIKYELITHLHGIFNQYSTERAIGCVAQKVFIPSQLYALFFSNAYCDRTLLVSVLACDGCSLVVCLNNRNTGKKDSQQWLMTRGHTPTQAHERTTHVYVCYSIWYRWSK